MTTIDSQTETSGEFRQTVHLRAHTFHADVVVESGGKDSAPGPHDYFDSALATCKALTATWYARRNGIPLERVESHVESDASEERSGKYKLRVRLTFHGQLSDADRKRLYAAASACPIQKLMTTSEVIIETAPFEGAGG
jgi:putative redox protein